MSYYALALFIVELCGTLFRRDTKLNPERQYHNCYITLHYDVLKSIINFVRSQSIIVAWQLVSMRDYAILMHFSFSTRHSHFRTRAMRSEVTFTIFHIE